MRRGLLSYEPCTTLELRRFIVDRCIGISATKPTKADLVAILETADDEACFPQFTKLPAELRLCIYTMYFDSFSEEIPVTPCQPPLVKVSSQVRLESLPVYYSTCVFELRMRLSASAPYVATADGANLEQFSLRNHSYVSPETKRLLSCTSPSNFARMKKVKLSVHGCGQWYIDTTNCSSEKSSPTVSLIEPEVFKPLTWGEREWEEMPRKIEEVLKALI